jgi:hypothetical protein
LPRDHRRKSRQMQHRPFGSEGYPATERRRSLAVLLNIYEASSGRPTEGLAGCITGLPQTRQRDIRRVQCVVQVRHWTAEPGGTPDYNFANPLLPRTWCSRNGQSGEIRFRFGSVSSYSWPAFPFEIATIILCGCIRDEGIVDSRQVDRLTSEPRSLLL